MKILRSQFKQGVVGETAILYDKIPQIAFIGRSNVGKSSTLNGLLGTKNMVKTGKTPGKTKEINFFEVTFQNDLNEQGLCYFVDLPGYGYAKLSHQARKKLTHLIDWYLFHSEIAIDLVCMIIDARRGMTELDRDMYEKLTSLDRTVLILVNKIDTLSQKKKHQLRNSLDDYFDADVGVAQPYILYSSKTGKHISHIRNHLFLNNYI